MKQIKIGAVAIGLMLAPHAAVAQVAIDMSRVTCGEVLALPADDSRLFGAWLSGWIAQKRGWGSIDVNNHAENVANMTKWCTQHKNASVMQAAEQFTAPKR